MLVLQRNAGEIIDIGDDIQIFVTCIKSRSVQLGIKAPRQVKILRHELTLENKRREREQVEVESDTLNEKQ